MSGLIQGVWCLDLSLFVQNSGVFLLDSVYVPQAEKVTDKAPVVKRKADDDAQQQKRPRPEGLWSTVDDLRTDLECFVRSQTRAANMFLQGSAKRRLKVSSLIHPLLE